MWAIASELAQRTIAMQVVPIPSVSGCSAWKARSLAFAAATSCSRRSPASSARWTSWSRSDRWCTAMADAVSPPACPPIPSQSSSRLGPA